MEKELEAAVKAHNEDGYKLVSTAPTTFGGNTSGIYLFFEKF